MEQLQTSANVEVLTARLASLIEANRLGAARPLLSAVRRLSSPSPYLTELAAHLAMREKRPELAQQELDDAVVQAPEHSGLRRCRANLRRQMGDIEGAARDAAEAVILDRSDNSAKALLGVLMLELRCPLEAIACLSEAVAIEPANHVYRTDLAVAHEAAGDADAALATLSAGILAAPGRIELRNAMTLFLLRRRDFTMAVEQAEEARLAGVVDACLFGLKGHALASLDRHTEAAEAYAEALKLDPEDPYVRHLAAASRGLRGTGRAPVDFLRTVFDDYAERFELHLVSLGNRVPGMIHDALLRHPALMSGEPVGPVLDLGCGTGLAALAVSDLPIGPITGVDVAPRMLAYAADKKLYADLREADLMQVLSEDAARWKLILAADVLVYFGPLEDVLAAVHARLEPGGWCIFSIEELLPDQDGRFHSGTDWALQRQGRYAHSMAYVAKVARDLEFTVRRLERQALRQEADAPLAGIFAVLERTRHDG
jgi:predicted TPR repeat methyltransferase